MISLFTDISKIDSSIFNSVMQMIHTGTVSLRVPDTLKEKMGEHSEINWSAVIRAHIEEEIEQLESRSIGHAVATSERLSNEIDQDDVKTENTAETIREWRNRRYGADSD